MKPIVPSGFEYAPPQDPLDIIFRDAHLIVVNKPAGLLSVPGKDPRHGDCLEIRVKTLIPNALLVHRIDMDTSGVMIFAATPNAQRHLGLQFERRHLSKTYEALVWGGPPETEGEMTLPLIADWPNRPLQKVCFETGKSAKTRWKALSRTEGITRIALFPETGRSHQLRVHMAELGCPVLGDRFYAGGEALAASPRLCLHSKTLTLRHPIGGAKMSFVAPVPF